MPITDVNLTFNVINTQVNTDQTIVAVTETEQVQVIVTPLGERGPAGASSGEVLWNSSNW
jgi:hypothetical protein